MPLFASVFSGWLDVSRLEVTKPPGSLLACGENLALVHRNPEPGNPPPRKGKCSMMMTARPAGTGTPSYSETWPCEPKSAHKARRLVEEAMCLWGMSDLAPVGEIIVSELATNTINHSKCRLLHVKISRLSQDTVRISVSDGNRWSAPVLRKAHPQDENGRGLHLVDLLSTKWGYDQKHWGKVVWAELQAAQVPGAPGLRNGSPECPAVMPEQPAIRVPTGGEQLNNRLPMRCST
ncbi:ATP-binding protein [Streptomyces sp. LB8]|nr:ATP-binding protein [Streptomyces sp. LB8]MDN5382495.1 ATP-binding protein [Streptomyces sp. LB8]